MASRAGPDVVTEKKLLSYKESIYGRSVQDDNIKEVKTEVHAAHKKILRNIYVE